MRIIAFSHTTPQFNARTKTVTRRTGLGWLKLIKAGDVLCAVEKARGVRREDRIELGHIKITNVRSEPLRRLLDDLDYGVAEVAREGYPDISPSEFVKFFRRINKGCTPDSEITRIEFCYLEATQTSAGAPGRRPG